MTGTAAPAVISSERDARGRLRGRLYLLTCAHCGGAFTAQRRHARYCTENCRQRACTARRMGRGHYRPP